MYNRVDSRSLLGPAVLDDAVHYVNAAARRTQVPKDTHLDTDTDDSYEKYEQQKGPKPPIGGT